MIATLVVVLATLAAEPINLRSGLAVSGVINSSRSVIRTDPVEAGIVAGAFRAPADGEAVGAGTWKHIQAGDDGAFPAEAAAKGYLFATADLPEPEVMLLEAQGHGLVYVNGDLRAGDPYAAGYVRMPVALSRGVNTFLFTGGRAIHARLVDPPAPVFVSDQDATLPDLTPGARGLLGSVVLVNAGTTPRDVSLVPSLAEAGPGTPERFTIPACTILKRGFTLPPSSAAAGTIVPLKVTLHQGDPQGPVVGSAEFTLTVRTPAQTRKRTFRSAVDGSVQYYTIVPPVGFDPASDRRYPMVVSLHGASVEATSQAGAYAAKPWCAIVCPTNRRPYGFDWEDWGRTDALEVMRDAGSFMKVDPTQTYLTGHSMGGHGTWQVGVQFPGLFAAIAPSAGWSTFWSYAAGPRQEPADPVAAVLRDASNISDTMMLLPNLRDTGVAILHGDADDNVPVTQARTMRDSLRALGVEPVYHEQPGAGHWWGSSDEPGEECLDWPAFFDLFARRRLPEDARVRRVSFVTVNPAVSASRHWATILAQHDSLLPSTIDIQADPRQRRFSGTTSNVERLALRTDAFIDETGPATVMLDGESLHLPRVDPGRAVYLTRVNGAWAPGGEPAPSLKGPRRAGPFKTAFDRRFTLVYGTRGTPEENAWAANLARLHAQVWYVRANGEAPVVSDTEWMEHPDPARNVILYGHSEMNSAWPMLRKDCPVSVTRGVVGIGGHEDRRDDACAFFTFPMRGTDDGLVAVIAGTGMPGMRLAGRTPIFLSGVGIPDVLVLDQSMLSQGAPGVLAAGFFGHDWSVSAGRIAWRARSEP